MTDRIPMRVNYQQIPSSSQYDDTKSKMRSKISLSAKITILAVILLSIFKLTILTRSITHLNTQLINPDYLNVIESLRDLETIADQHGGSRSITNGHRASTKYILDKLKSMDSFKVWTQEVLVDIQVDDQPPILVLHPTRREPNKLSFIPRLQVASVSGSGSIDLVNVKLKVLDTCVFNSSDDNWVAVLDTTSNESCSACDRLVMVVREGARGVVFIGQPGNQRGYPHPLPPNPGRCHKDEKYLEVMKNIGVVSISDDAARIILKSIAAHSHARIDLKVVTAYRSYPSQNVIAESKTGDASKIVIFGSHLDSVPAGPGINDDGSGAMATLELAKSFHQSPLSNSSVQRIRFAWWTAEEVGLIGSKFYVDDLATRPDELAAHKLNIDTDMIASSNYVRGVWNGKNIKDAGTRNKTQSISRVIKAYFHSLKLPTFDFEFNGRSDFAPFLDHGIPAGGVITGEDEIKSLESARLFGGISGLVLDHCDRVESIIGSGEVILEQNMKALAYVLQYYATAEDIDELLTAN